jgi:hypothetical protein
MRNIDRPLRKLGQRLLALEAEVAARCLQELDGRGGLAADALARVASHAHETLANPPRFARRAQLGRLARALRDGLVGVLARLWRRRDATEDALATIAAVRAGVEIVRLVDLLADSADDAGLRRWCAVWLERRRAAAFVSEAELRAALGAGRGVARLARRPLAPALAEGPVAAAGT